MASVSFYNRFCKGVVNTNDSTRMTWWKTSFNMPVQDIFANLANWVEGSGPFNYLGTATSFDLSGFEPGWEAIAGFTGFRIVGPFGGGVITFKQSWRNPSGSIMFENEQSVSFGSLPDSSYWNEWMLGSNQGVASWEIASSGTYSLVATMSGALTGSQTFNVTFSNVPNTSTTYTPGMMWVEGTQLCYVSANGHIHRISGNTNGSPGSQYAGAIWCATGTNDIYWIGTNGVKYYSNSLAVDYSRRTLKQVWSAWSGGSNSEVNAGTDKAGFIWADNEFGWEHLGFIGKDGYKWLLYSGNYPYADPN